MIVKFGLFIRDQGDGSVFPMIFPTVEEALEEAAKNEDGLDEACNEIELTLDDSTYAVVKGKRKVVYSHD